MIDLDDDGCCVCLKYSAFYISDALCTSTVRVGGQCVPDVELLMQRC